MSPSLQTFVECKLKEKPQAKDVQGIRKLEKFYGSKEMADSYVAIPGDGSFGVKPGITAV